MLGRQKPAFKASEKDNQSASKQRARKKPGVLAKEYAAKAVARKKPCVLAKKKKKKNALLNSCLKDTRCSSKRMC